MLDKWLPLSSLPCPPSRSALIFWGRGRLRWSRSRWRQTDRLTSIKCSCWRQTDKFASTKCSCWRQTDKFTSTNTLCMYAKYLCVSTFGNESRRCLGSQLREATSTHHRAYDRTLCTGYYYYRNYPCRDHDWWMMRSNARWHWYQYGGYTHADAHAHLHVRAYEHARAMCMCMRTCTRVHTRTTTRTQTLECNVHPYVQNLDIVVDPDQQ